MAKANRSIALHGTVIEAADYNAKAIFGDLPTKQRNQIIGVQLDEDFWQIMHVKKIKIIVEENQLPAQIRETVRWQQARKKDEKRTNA
jgi:hypothetical protein